MHSSLVGGMFTADSKTRENLLERYFLWKKSYQIEIYFGETQKIVNERSYKIYYDVSRKVQYGINVVNG